MKKWNYKRAVKELFGATVQALDRKEPLSKTRKKLFSIVGNYPLTTRQKKAIWWEFYSFIRATRHQENWEKALGKAENYEHLFKTVKRVDRDYKLKARKAKTRALLDRSDTIFFICSKHSNCADDHKAYQGKVYVDRFWRTKVSGSDYYAVLSYIRNRQIMTVQDVVKEPVYMTTRPNCRHYFVPLDTGTVLHSSVNKLVKNSFPKKYTREEYYKEREKIYTELNNTHPCKEFGKYVK